MTPKKSFSASRRTHLNSFTLVELLVVIGMIAILAAVLLAAANNAIKAAKRAQALNMASQIQNGVQAYFTEYSTYPIPNTFTATNDCVILSGDKTSWQNLTWALAGNVNPAFPAGVVTPTVPNARSIQFFSPKQGDIEHSNPPVAGDSGIPLNPINPYTAPANQYYNIAMDGDYDGVLGKTATGSANAITNFAQKTMPTTAVTQTVAVWANCNTSGGTNNNYYIHTF